MLVASDRVPHNELAPRLVEDEYETMAAVEEIEAADITPRQGEASARDTIGGHESRREGGFAKSCVEETEEGRVATVVDAEAAEEGRDEGEEAWVGDEGAPALVDERGAGEEGRLRWEAEEDLGKQIVVVQRRSPRRAAAAGHLATRRPRT